MKASKRMGRKRIYKILYPSARVHHLSLWMNDKDGTVIYTEDKIRECINNHEGAWSEAAWILHDEDEYDAEDVFQHAEKNRKTYIDRLQVLSDAKGLAKDETTESGFVRDEELEKRAQEYADEQFPPIEKGQKKPPHWHIILTFAVNRNAGEVARWFGAEPNRNEVKTGKGAAEAAFLYLVHARHPKKHQYESSLVGASFDYENELKAMLEKQERHEKYHIDSDTLNDVLEAVGEGLSIKEAQMRVSRAVYYRNKRLFEEARKDYIQNRAPMPLWREVFYVESEGIDEDFGRGGLGKTACCYAFAKHLAKEFGANPAYGAQSPEMVDYIYTCGDTKVFMQNYMGQPVVVIDEISGNDMKRAMKGVNGVKALLAPFPERKSVDKKHGDVLVVAKYIVINGIQSFEKFIHELAEGMEIEGVRQESEEAQIEQFNRRIWGKIKIIDATKLEFWVNRGLFDNTPEQQLLTRIATVRAGFQMLKSQTSGEAQAEIEGRILRPLLAEVAHSQEVHSPSEKITEVEHLTDELLQMGEMLQDDVATNTEHYRDENGFEMYRTLDGSELCLLCKEKNSCPLRRGVAFIVQEQGGKMPTSCKDFKPITVSC